MQKPFEEVAFALNVGEISDIVDTDSGAHIILRTGWLLSEDSIVSPELDCYSDEDMGFLDFSILIFMELWFISTTVL